MHAHDHSDDHGHDGSSHHGHSHGVSRNADKRWLTLALALLLAFMVAEVVVGIMARSLALISDAGHMLTDVGSIALALFAIRMAARPAHGRYTFGFKRVEILSAQANGLTLLLLAAWFVYEAIQRLITPPPVQGSLMTLVAIAGIVVNLAVVWIMGKANRQSLNIQGSYAHILNDLYAFIVAALVVAALMLKAGIELVRDSGRIFLEASPKNLDPAAVRASILATAGVTAVNDLHIWEVTSGFPALSGHIFVRPEDDCHGKRRELETMLRDGYGIEHATLQMDHARDSSRLVTGCRHDAA